MKTEAVYVWAYGSRSSRKKCTKFCVSSYVMLDSEEGSIVDMHMMSDVSIEDALAQLKNIAKKLGITLGPIEPTIKCTVCGNLREPVKVLSRAKCQRCKKVGNFEILNLK